MMALNDRIVSFKSTRTPSTIKLLAWVSGVCDSIVLTTSKDLCTLISECFNKMELYGETYERRQMAVTRIFGVYGHARQSTYRLLTIHPYQEWQ
jgi:hypothetical protein